MFTSKDWDGEQIVQVYLGSLYVLKYLQGLAQEMEKNNARS